MDQSSDQEIDYIAYNGITRIPMIPKIGVPLVAGMVIASPVIILATYSGMIFGLKGFALLLILVPIFIFLRQICENDDHAIDVLAREIKWTVKGVLSPRHLHGKTTTFAPINYKRNLKHAEQFIRKNIRGRG